MDESRVECRQTLLGERRRRRAGAWVRDGSAEVTTTTGTSRRSGSAAIAASTPAPSRLRHHQVEQHEVEAVVAQPGERLYAVGGLLDVAGDSLQHRPQRGAERRVVVDDEDPADARAVAGERASSAPDRRPAAARVNVLPRPTSLSTVSSPPSNSTTRRE